MTIQLEPPATTEFPTLDLAELDHVELRPAVHLTAFERPEFPAALAAALPTVVHAVRQVAELHDEHEFIDTATGAAVRLVITLEHHKSVARIAEIGPAGLWDQIVTATATWNLNGRPATP